MNKILIIAELGNNFLGNIDWAKKMIWEAKKCGADIAKFQLYNIDKIKKPWQSRYFELMMGQLTFKQVKELKKECDKAGIEFMASVFDIERVVWCEMLGVKRYKIASRSIHDTELIKVLEKTKKSIIASLGDWNKKELPKIKNAQFLYCVSEYPAYFTNGTFPAKFDKYEGFSDHSIGMYWCREAVKRGATIIEKHFTLNKDLPGHDQKGSAEPWELKDFVSYCRQYERGIQF
ncbi:MAG: hypothetical protein A2163_07185 [Actinobacteria bacterium RBG_13_35_12]|nr:MAG: hypothetical protein A2163_07185 [Actinobacteria bacterium RBG_13_35_12]